MNWKKALLDYLAKGFTASIHRKGNQMLSKLDGIKFEYHESRQSIESSIALMKEGRVYFVTLETIDFESIALFGTCSCTKGKSCVHLAALTLGLLKEIREGKPGTIRKLGLDKVAPPPEPIQPTIPEADIVRMPKRSVDRPRKLPLDHYDNLGLLIENCAPVRKLEMYGHTMVGEVLEDHRLQLRSVRREWNGKEHINYAVELIPENGSLDIICHRCTSLTDRLCKHQHHALSEFQHTLNETGYLREPDSFKNYFTEQAKVNGFPIEDWQQYFRLEIKPKEVNILPKSPSIFPPQWVDDVLDHRDMIGSEFQDIYTPPIDTLSDNTAEIGYGILWYEDNYKVGQDIPLRFISGEKYKSKSGINLRTMVSSRSPYMMAGTQPDLLMPLVSISLDTNPERSFEKMQAYLSANLDEVNKVYNYVYTGDLQDEQIDTKKVQLVKFKESPITARFEIRRVAGYYEIEMLLSADDEPISLASIIYFNNYFAATKYAIYVWENYALSDYFVHFIDSNKILLGANQVKGIHQLAADLRRHFTVDIAEELHYQKDLLVNPRYQIYLSEAGERVYFEPMLSYDQGIINALTQGAIKVDQAFYHINDDDRNGLVHFLKNAHHHWHELPFDNGRLSLRGIEMIHQRWFVAFAEACSLANIELLGRDTLTAYKLSSFAGKGSFSISSGIEWFDVDASLTFGEEEVPFAIWIQAIKEGNNYVELKDGSYGLLPEKWLKGMVKMLKVVDVEKGGIKISKYRFNIIEDLDAKIDTKTTKELAVKRTVIQDYCENKKKQKLSSKIKATLRPYQLDGYQWLTFLDDTNSGGILADDMGLGKTLQVISLLARQKSKAPSLIVVPRSLLYNWAAELDKFCPSLKYIIHHGPQRTQTSNDLDIHQLIITTYDTGMRDHEWLKEIHFNYIILDESQAIKNIQSKRYKALRHLQARNRLAMTGTPIENNTFDLYAQLSFTSPGLLGTQSGFKNNFALPIDKNGSQEAAILLQKMIHPYVLRRTKAQVAKDLPEKVEQILYCDMSTAQRTMYDQLKLKIIMDLEAAKTKTKKGQMRFKILDGLLRLRQMCNAPHLVNKSLSADPADAVKVQLLLDQLKSVTPNHKVLVFSQFVQMLGIIQREVEKAGIPFVYLDGQTKNRQAVVDEFQNDPDIKVFLISLKAGNTGLNLTAAEYVYIVDPWWNPAVEAQAIDRTHRIGQTNNVFAYRMICRDSIEEKILELQQKKRALASDIIQVDEDVAKQLDENELMDLFN